MPMPTFTDDEILNRIDDPGGCHVMLELSYVIEYCPNPEYHPFSGTCIDHAIRVPLFTWVQRNAH